MIKKIIGKIAALGIVAVVVFTVLGHGTYTSMLPDDMFSAGDASNSDQKRDADAAEGAERADSLGAKAAAKTAE